MWELVNRTRFAAERSFLRDRDGAEILIVVVKATFTIGEGGSVSLAEQQAPIATSPRHFGDPLRSSLVSDADFVLRKSLTDVLVIGHAHTRDAQPSIAVEVSARVGLWQKRLVAFGDRRWKRDLSGFWLSDPEPFSKMHLVYERAFGGEDVSGGEPRQCEANPVGVGFSQSSHPVEEALAPNLEDPNNLIHDPSDQPQPMSLGPIAREWPLRRRLGGTFDERWRRERHPLVPDDFDDAFWQSAPEDQRTQLRGGEEVTLTGLSPRGPIQFELPRVALSFCSRVGGDLVEHESSLHTVLFEPDESRVVMTFQSALPCHHTIHSLEETTVDEAAS